MVALSKSFSCNPCGNVFETKTKLRSHRINIKLATKLHKCKTCLLEFSKKKTLILHENLHGFNSDDLANPKLHKCKACSRTFTNSSGLLNHLKVHTNKGNQRCEKCLVEFTDKGSLKFHILKKHSNNDPMTCDHCMCIYTGETQLNRHIQRVHVGSDPQGCKKCSNYSEEDYLRQLMDFS